MQRVIVIRTERCNCTRVLHMYYTLTSGKFRAVRHVAIMAIEQITS